MGFGNYEICDLWDFGIMGEGGRRGAKQRGEKGRARALVHHFLFIICSLFLCLGGLQVRVQFLLICINCIGTCTGVKAYWCFNIINFC